MDRRKLLMRIQTFMAVMAVLFAVLIVSDQGLGLSDQVRVWMAYSYVVIGGVKQRWPTAGEEHPRHIPAASGWRRRNWRRRRRLSLPPRFTYSVDSPAWRSARYDP